MTVPDMDQDSLLSSNWPIHLGSYNRKKKLIRDVSTKSEQVRQHFLSTGQLQRIPAPDGSQGVRQSAANLGVGQNVNGFASAQNFMKGEQQKKNANANTMKRKGQFDSSRGLGTRVQSALPKTAQGHSQPTLLNVPQANRTTSGHGLSSMQQQFMPMQNSTSRQSPGAVANIQNTSGTSVSNDLIAHPPRGSYRVGVMTSTHQAADARYLTLLPS